MSKDSTPSKNYSKYIYDNIHGNIGVTETELRIIDTRIFQRLHRIKQLGPANVVYPGATHSRFAHSIGAMFVMEQYLQNVRKDGNPIAESRDDEQKLRLAALLHDVGHYPLSHSLEVPIKEKFNGHTHEKHSTHIIKTILKDKLDTYTPEDIIQIIERTYPNDIYSTLISSDMDVDKVDYLLRDSYHTGVSYGNVDVDRLLRTMSFDNEGNIIFEKGGPVIENFLLGRYHMFQAVYTHKVVIAFEQMIEKIYELFVNEGEVDHPSGILESEDESMLSRFDDDYIWQTMNSYHQKKKSGFLAELVDAVLIRKPIVLSVQKASSEKKGKQPDDWRRVLLVKEDKNKKDELASKAGIESQWLFPYTPKKPISVIPDDTPILIKKQHENIPLDEDTSLAIHKLVDLDFYDARIYTKREYETKVKDAFDEL